MVDRFPSVHITGAVDKQIYCRFVKMDAATRVVKGWASQEVPDKSREVMDYEGSKPYFKAWSDSFHEATGGLSRGNVREMHGSSAAGKLNVFEPDDAAKGFWIEAEIVDDGAWAKCEKGVYTGFSIGGSYVKKWDDPVHKGCTRFIAKPAEVSVVDNPCCGAAVFKFTTAEGVEELRKFESTVSPVAYFGEMYAKASKGVKSELMEALMKRADSIEDLGHQIEVTKSMYDVAELAAAISALNSVRIWLKMQAEWADEDATIPDQLTAPVKALGAILQDLVAQETTALTADLDVVLLASTATEGLEKSAMNEQQMKKYLEDNGYVTKAVHDATLQKAEAATVAAKAATDAITELTKADGVLAGLQKAVKLQSQFIEAMTKKLSPAKIAVQAVAKTADQPSGEKEGVKVVDTSKVNKSADTDAMRLEVIKGIIAGGGFTGGGPSADATTAAAIA
jgi:hypothetical protein